MTRTLVTPGTDADLIGLELADLGGGESLERRCEQETVVVVLSGVVEASADGTSLGHAGGRTSVFDGPGHAVYAPPGTQLRLTAQGEAELAIATAPLDGRPPRRSARRVRRAAPLRRRHHGGVHRARPRRGGHPQRLSPGGGGPRLRVVLPVDHGRLWPPDDPVHRPGARL